MQLGQCPGTHLPDFLVLEGRLCPPLGRPLLFDPIPAAVIDSEAWPRTICISALEILASCLILLKDRRSVGSTGDEYRTSVSPPPTLVGNCDQARWADSRDLYPSVDARISPSASKLPGARFGDPPRDSFATTPPWKGSRRVPGFFTLRWCLTNSWSPLNGPRSSKNRSLPASSYCRGQDRLSDVERGPRAGDLADVPYGEFKPTREVLSSNRRWAAVRVRKVGSGGGGFFGGGTAYSGASRIGLTVHE